MGCVSSKVQETTPARNAQDLYVAPCEEGNTPQAEHLQIPDAYRLRIGGSSENSGNSTPMQRRASIGPGMRAQVRSPSSQVRSSSSQTQSSAHGSAPHGARSVGPFASSQEDTCAMTSEQLTTCDRYSDAGGTFPDITHKSSADELIAVLASPRTESESKRVAYTYCAFYSKDIAALLKSEGGVEKFVGPLRATVNNRRTGDAPLVVEALKSLRTIVSTHPQLRAVFVERGCLTAIVDVIVYLNTAAVVKEGLRAVIALSPEGQAVLFTTQGVATLQTVLAHHVADSEISIAAMRLLLIMNPITHDPSVWCVLDMLNAIMRCHPNVSTVQSLACQCYIRFVDSFTASSVLPRDGKDIEELARTATSTLRSKPVAVASSLRCLRALANNKERGLLDVGVVEACVECIRAYPQHPDVALVACDVVYLLAQNERAGKFVLQRLNDVGGIAHIVHSASCRLSAGPDSPLHVLALLVRIDAEMCAKDLCAAKGIHTICEYLSTTGEEDMSREIVGTLGRMCSVDARASQQLADPQCIGLLCQAMTRHPAKVAKPIIRVLSAISENHAALRPSVGDALTCVALYVEKESARKATATAVVEGMELICLLLESPTVVDKVVVGTDGCLTSLVHIVSKLHTVDQHKVGVTNIAIHLSRRKECLPILRRNCANALQKLSTDTACKDGALKVMSLL